MERSRARYRPCGGQIRALERDPRTWPVNVAAGAAVVVIGVVSAMALPSAAAPTAPGRNGLIAFVNVPAGGSRWSAPMGAASGC